MDSVKRRPLRGKKLLVASLGVGAASLMTCKDEAVANIQVAAPPAADAGRVLPDAASTASAQPAPLDAGAEAVRDGGAGKDGGTR